MTISLKSAYSPNARHEHRYFKKFKVVKYVDIPKAPVNKQSLYSNILFGNSDKLVNNLHKAFLSSFSSYFIFFVLFKLNMLLSSFFAEISKVFSSESFISCCIFHHKMLRGLTLYVFFP